MFHLPFPQSSYCDFCLKNWICLISKFCHSRNIQIKSFQHLIACHGSHFNIFIIINHQVSFSFRQLRNSWFPFKVTFNKQQLACCMLHGKCDWRFLEILVTVLLVPNACHLLGAILNRPIQKQAPFYQAGVTFRDMLFGLQSLSVKSYLQQIHSLVSASYERIF